MIISTLTQSERIETLHPLFKQVFDFVKQNDFLSMPIGRIELDEDRLFINNSESELIPKEAQVLEIHKKYLDIHIPLDGCEVIGWKPAEKLSRVRTSYDESVDIAFYTDVPDTYVSVLPGQFAVIYPEDAHAPLIGKGNLRKLIVKVKIE